ncbi:MAG: four helix bundle protein [Cyclobacteriaceae bacterium]
MRNFIDLEIFHEAHRIVKSVYAVTRSFPKEEVYGLTSQIRRSAVSIPSNIAEGCGRATEKELARFCNISMGSASELEYQLYLSSELGYLSSDDYHDIKTDLIRCKKRMNAFIQKLR